MKTVTCASVGGDTCKESFSTETPKEMREKLIAHIKTAHPDMAEKVTPEISKEWDAMFLEVWDKTPEDKPTEKQV